MSVLEAIDDTSTMASFPVTSNREQHEFRSDDSLVFVPIADSPGVAFIVADKKSIHQEVLLAVLRVWPYVLFLLVFSYLAGIVLWVTVRSGINDFILFQQKKSEKELIYFSFK